MGLLRIARREVPNALRGKASASDLVQQTFLEAVRDFAQFQGSTVAELRAWLRRILRNNLANLTRRLPDDGQTQGSPGGVAP